MSQEARKVALITLGCRLNQYETDSLAGDFAAAGFSIIDKDTPGADVCVINTCTVTGRGEQKSRQAVARVRRQHPEALIMLTGCAVERNAEAFASTEGVILVDQDKKHAIVRLALIALDAKNKDPASSQSMIKADRFGFTPPAVSLHTRATLKVQDGCDNQCSYCIVPSVRGKAKSRPLEDCLSAARQLVALGYHEIVLTGVNLQQYAHAGYELTDLVQALLALPESFRLRLSSIEPDETSPRIISLFENPRLCPHLHLCLQSGSDRTLLRMGRRYTSAMFLDLIGRLREIDPLFNITGDVIVGYPGETVQDFEETLATLKQAALTHAHTFQFSPREGTKAFLLGEQIPAPEMRRRSEGVRALVAENRARYLVSMQDQNQTILVERADVPNHTVRGYGQHFIPITLAVPEGEILPQTNTLVPCRISGIVDGKTPGLRGVGMS
jgi:threonylcarbamoyladenosine tRNA methylthiotransferase MtaB